MKRSEEPRVGAFASFPFCGERKHGYEVVSVDRMESIIGRIEAAANNNQTCINCVAVEKAFAMHAKAAELHEMNYTTQKEVER